MTGETVKKKTRTNPGIHEILSRAFTGINMSRVIPGLPQDPGQLLIHNKQLIGANSFAEICLYLELLQLYLELLQLLLIRCTHRGRWSRHFCRPLRDVAFYGATTKNTEHRYDCLICSRRTTHVLRGAVAQRFTKLPGHWRSPYIKWDIFNFQQRIWKRIW